MPDNTPPRTTPREDGFYWVRHKRALPDDVNQIARFCNALDNGAWYQIAALGYTTEADFLRRFTILGRAVCEPLKLEPGWYWVRVMRYQQVLPGEFDGDGWAVAGLSLTYAPSEVTVLSDRLQPPEIP